MDIENPFFIIIFSIFGVINIIAFLIMFFDKHKAINEQRRVPEGKIFFMAAMFGALGVFAGMYAFRHKTQKWRFTVGVPLILVQNITFCLYLIYVLTNFVEF